MPSATPSPTTASPEAMIAVRLMQIQAFTRDAESTIADDAQVDKQKFLKELIRATASVAPAYPAGHTRHLLAALSSDNQLLDSISECASAITARLTPHDLVSRRRIGDRYTVATSRELDDRPRGMLGGRNEPDRAVSNRTGN